MAHDRFGLDYYALSQPLRELTAVDLTSDTSFDDYPRALYVGTSGNVVVDPLNGTGGQTIYSLAAGVWHPIRVKKIYSTAHGTSASHVMVGY